MKKILLLTGLLVCAVLSFAQVDPKERSIAMQLVESNKIALGLSSAELNEVIIHTAYQIPKSDIRMVYLQQGYKGIPVYNQMQVLAFRNGKVVSNAGGLLSSPESRTNGHSGVPSISSVTAVNTALRSEKLQSLEVPNPINVSENGRKAEFGTLGVNTENVSAELLWLPLNEGKQLRLVWQVFLTPRNSSDYLLVRVDATSNTVVDKYNLTVTCNWDGDKHSVEEHYNKKHFDSRNTSKATEITNFVLRKDEKKDGWKYRPFVVNNATYRVIRYPAESPNHPGGAPANHTNPWTWAPGNATSLGWHFDGTTYFDSTRGNNVWAYDDRDANNLPGRSTLSSTPQPDLTFTDNPDFTVDPTQRSPVPNQQFNTTNLFYWNNLMHDITYIYGWDEAARNFQNDNQGRGGLGGDYVLAEAQDGSGTNNANFATPADGSRPRMQMFLWTTPNPDKDGDADNGIIAHEYGHGISNRLTGSGLGCLSGSEQMGEGWSDYYSLMVTHNWATAVPTDGFNNPRGIGTYALDQPTNGPGIRTHRYTTNMAINPLTYANLPTQAVPHGVGTIWCTALWDMTWEIIGQAGINPNLFNPAAGGGNAIALKLVQEGMRLQPCNPGFIDGRNAILKADTLFFGSQYSCAILRAFARRGMGIGASQGTSSSINDQIVSFNDGGSSFTLTQSVNQQFELGNIVYTNSLTASCQALTNYTLTDTIPTHVTWVSGGTYNPATRVVSFPVNLASGASQDYQFTIQINAGSYFPPAMHIDDQVLTAPPAIPAQWTATSTTGGTNVWVVTNTQSRSAPNAYFTNDPAVVSDQILRSTGSFALSNLPSALHRLSFWHRFTLENGFDGGVIEISTNAGGTWQDLGPYIIQGQNYTGTLSTLFGNPLSGRNSFTGSVTTFQQTVVNLNPFAGQSVMIRFRMGSDNSIGSTGWWIDDIQLSSSPVVIMKSNLFNASMVKQADRTVIADIISNVCIPASITTQPQNQFLCNNSNALFSVAALGNGLSYQWELSTDNGATFNPIPGATNSAYSIAGATSALNGRQYRVVITGLCGNVTSNAATLYVSTPVTRSSITATPPLICGAPAASSISGTAAGGTVGTNITLASSGTINMAIPDNNTTGINSAITVPTFNFAAAQNMKLRVNMNHTWVGDVIVTLTSPCGTTFAFDRPGVPAATFGNSADLSGVYIFDLAAATIIPETGGGVIAAGNYLPSNAAGAPHTWAGLTFPCSASGTWTLNVQDRGAGDNGTLVDWALIVGGGYTHTLTGPGTITPLAPTGTNNATGNFNVTGLPVGTHTFTMVSRDIFGCQVSSNINVVVGDLPVITQQPIATAVCAGTNATFTVATAATTLSPTYQWQLSTNFGGTWNNVPGATSATLTVVAPTMAQNGHQYRVIVGSTCGSTTSLAVTLSVFPTPTHVNVSATPNPVCEGSPVTITGTAQGGSLLPTPVSSGVINLAIPDGNAAGINSNLTVPANTFANASNLKVRVQMTHTWVGDVRLQLTSPCGVTLLFDRPGVPAGTFGNASDMNGVYIFDLGAATVIPESGSPAVIPAGTYLPSNTAGASHTWAGLTFPCNTAGTWTLNAQDNAAGDVGTIVEWAIMDAGPAVYVHTLTGPGTINTLPPTGPNNQTANYTVTGLAAGTHNFLLTTTSGFGCSVSTPISVTVSPKPPIVFAPAAPVICRGASQTITILDTTRQITGGGAITINASGNANPYPSVLAVSGIPAGAIVSSVQINGFSHTFPSDVDAVLVSPTGTPVILMSDCGSGTDAINFNYVFRDGSPAMTTTVNPSGTYRPTNFTTPDNFPAPGPGNLTQANPLLSDFTGNMNGTWNLYVVDDLGGDAGSIQSWSITFAVPGATTITYTWSPATGLNQTTGSSVIATPTTTTTYTVNATNTLTGCTNSGTVTVTVNQLPAITVQPTPATQDVCAGNTVSYTVTATGTGITYQWRKDGVPLVNGGNISGATTPTLTITAVTAANAGTYTVVVSGVCPPAVTSNPVVLRVGIAPTITTQPQNRTVCSGQNTFFSIVPSVIPATNIGYQWQVSTDGGATWNNVPGTVPGAFMDTLRLNNVTTAMNNNRYRVIVTSACGLTVTSNAGILTVNAAPVVSATDLWNLRVCLSDTLIPLNGTPVGGSWSGIGVSGTNFIPTATAVGTYVLTYSFTSQNGCTVTDTTSVRVQDCPERIIRLVDDAVILWPNPNNGQFNIRMNSTLYNYLGMRVFNSAGQLVSTRTFNGLVFGRVVPIDLRHLPSGTYMVKFFYDAAGVRTSEKTFKVVIGR